MSVSIGRHDESKKYKSSQLCISIVHLNKPFILFNLFQHHFFCSFRVNNHFIGCESRSLQPAYKQLACSPQPLIVVAIKLHAITVRCGGMATMGQVEKGKGRESGSRLE